MFDLRLTTGCTSLRHVRESDLPHLAEVQPDDYEHDPTVAPLAGHDLPAHRRRVLYQGYWRSVGTWSPDSWCLDFIVEHAGQVVGVQSLEADQFLSRGTVDSTSWLVGGVRGRGIGIAMRQAVLSLAFDGLGALAAVFSARPDNGASLGVSRRLGYQDNGVSLNVGSSGLQELRHLRLTAAEWRSSGLGREVRIEGLSEALPWFGQHDAGETT